MEENTKNQNLSEFVEYCSEEELSEFTRVMCQHKLANELAMPPGNMNPDTWFEITKQSYFCRLIFIKNVTHAYILIHSDEFSLEDRITMTRLIDKITYDDSRRINEA